MAGTTTAATATRATNDDAITVPAETEAAADTEAVEAADAVVVVDTDADDDAADEDPAVATDEVSWVPWLPFSCLLSSFCSSFSSFELEWPAMGN